MITVESLLVEDDGVELEEDGRDCFPTPILGDRVELGDQLLQQLVLVLRGGKLGAVETLHEGDLLVLCGCRIGVFTDMRQRHHGRCSTRI